ncbi:MAG: glycosyltransferase family 4 protein [Spartobacteria bacterium]
MTSPSRILCFAHETTWSGAPIQLFHLVRWLQSEGYEVAVAVPKPETAESGPISDELQRIGVEIFSVIDLSARPDLAGLSELCARFDLVVANTLVMWAPVRAAYEAAVPVIWYIHESLVAEQLIAQIPEIHPALGLADLIVMPTHRTARLYAGWTDRPIEVVPYGIPEVQPALTNTSSKKRNFLLLGTYEPRKGQDLFLRAIGELDAGVRDRAVFRMGGRILDRAFHANLAREAAKYPNVHLLEALSHEEALAANAASDVLVCSSRDETMPVAILEAMSLGKAIITASVGGVTQWLQDGVNALLVPPEDSPALVAALRRCIEKENLVHSLGQQARKTFRDNFSLNQLGRHFVALFERVKKEKTR